MRRTATVRTAARGALLVAVLATAPGAAPAAAEAQPLFKDDSLVHVHIATDLRTLVRERDSTRRTWHDATVRFADAPDRLIAAEVRNRGHFRRQARNCDFPPVLLKVKADERRGTLLQGNRQVKLVVPCRPGRTEYERWIQLEYAAYRMYAVVQPVHPRTRLARFTFRDTARPDDSLVVDGFFLETDDEVGREHDLTLREFQGALFEDLEPAALDRLALFALMIGNVDWSIGALHNVYLLQDTTTGTMVPVGYDWDWTGFVNPRYARPNRKLGVRRMTDRLHRGPCRTREAWEPTIAFYHAHREALDRAWREVPGLTERSIRRTERFLAGFWELLDDPRRFRDEVEQVCLRGRN